MTDYNLKEEFLKADEERKKLGKIMENYSSDKLYLAHGQLERSKKLLERIPRLEVLRKLFELEERIEQLERLKKDD